MARDEATIRFNAETAGFKSEIKSLDSYMSTLRSELKLNESEFKATGDSVAYLENKQRLLESQLSANKGKQEALNAEIRAANECYGEGSAKAEQLQRQLNYVEAQGKGLQTQFDSCTSELEAQTSAMGELTATIESQEQKLQSLKEDYASSVVESGKWSDESLELANSISILSQELLENKKQAENANNAANELDESFKKTRETTTGSFNGVKDIILGTGITELLGDIGAKALDMASDFDEASAVIVEGTGASGDALRDMEQAAVDSFGSMKNAEADLGDVSGVVAELNTRLGITGDEVKLAADDFLSFSHHVGEDAVGSVDSIVDVMKRWGLETDEIPGLLDDLTTANQACKMSVGEMTKYLTDNSVQFQELGYGIDDSIAMMMAFSDGGANTSSVMMGMKQAVANLSSETDDVPSAFQEALKTIESCDSVSEALTKTVGNTGKTVQEVFGKRAAQEIATCVQSGNFDLERFSSALEDNQGAMQDTAENATTMADEWSRATNNIAVAFDSTLAPAISDFVHTAADGAQGFADLDEGSKQLAVKAGIAAIAAKPLSLLWGKMSPILGKVVTSAKATTISLVNLANAEKRQAAAANLSAKASRLFGGALKTIAPIAIVSVILDIANAIGEQAKISEEALQHQEKYARATNSLGLAASKSGLLLEEEAASVEKLDAAISSVDIDGLIDDHINLANNLEESNRQTDASVTQLEDYGNTIDSLLGKKLDDAGAADLKIALEGVNRELGTNYELVEDSGGKYKVMSDGAEVAKDKILELIDAQELQMRLDATRESRESAYKKLMEETDAATKAHDDYLAATNKVAEAEARRDAITRQAGESMRDYEDRLAAAKRGVELAKNEQDTANRVYEEAKGLADDAQSSVNKYAETEKLLTMAMSEGSSAMVDAAAKNQDFQSGVLAAGANLVDFTGFLEDMGFTADEVADISMEDSKLIAAQWKQAADACDGDVDKMTWCLKNYNNTPILDKKGNVTADTTQLIDAEGKIYKWNGQKLYDKNGEVKTEVKGLQDAQGNLVDWNKTTLKPITGEAKAKYDSVTKANDAIKDFRNFPSNLGTKTAYVELIEKKLTSSSKSKKTKSARGGIFPNAQVQKHASGFFVDRPTTIGYTGDVEHIAGEAGLEYVGYGEGATVLPLTDPKMRPWARAVAQEMGLASQPVAASAKNVNITMNITVQGSMDDGVIDKLATDVRRAVRMGVR